MSTYGYDTYGYDYGAVESTAGAIVGGIIAIIVIAMIISLAIAACTIIGQWKAFKKAGKNGWEAIIPVYNMVVLCQISGVNPWWVLIYFAGSIVLNIIPVIGQLASMALSVYFKVLLYVSAARSFGKSDGYAAGLIFLAPIFWLLVGGKNTQYVGPRPMNDVVWNFVEEKFFNNGTQTAPNGGYQQAPNGGYQQAQPQNAPAAKFCTGCGYKITNGERFCPSCGKEVQ